MAMYPEEIVSPMRKELVNLGIKELKDVKEVDSVMKNNKNSMMIVINSICGCAARTARPALKNVLHNSSVIKPNKMVTVFAGQDEEATSRVREYLKPYPPSSPSIAIFKNKKIFHMFERHDIMGKEAEVLAGELKDVFDKL